MPFVRLRFLWFLIAILCLASCGGNDEEDATPPPLQTAAAGETTTPRPATPLPTSDTAPATNEDTPPNAENPPGSDTSGDGAAAPTVTDSGAGVTRLQPAAPLPLPPALDVVVAPEPVGFDEFIDRAKALSPALQALQDSVDRSLFDPVALNFDLAFEPEALVAFVANEIAFEQYPGALRGAEGTLRGRAGNALDQALLLTRLLEDAGYEWRLQQGQLSEADARRLLARMGAPRPPAPAPGEPTVLEAEFVRLFNIKGDDPNAGEDFVAVLADEPVGEAWQSYVVEDTAFINGALAAAGITLGDQSAAAALLAEAQDYFWVEFRLDAFDDWRPAHPALGEAPDVSPTETYREIPEALFHRVQISVFIEQKVGDELFVSSIVNTPEWPAAALAGRPLTFVNQPNNLAFDTPVGSMLDETGLLLPQINGQVAGNGFDLDGRVYDLTVLAGDKYGVRELFQAVGGGVEGALAALGGLSEDGAPVEDPDDVFTLTAQWIEYTVIAPDGARETHRRYLLDRIGPENRAAGSAAIPASDRGLAVEGQALLSDWTIVVQSGRYNVAYFIDRWTARQQAEIEILNALDPDAPNLGLPTDLAQRLVPLEDLLTDVAAAFPSTDEQIIFVSEPNIIVFERGLLPGDGSQFFERVDIVNNTRRAIATAGDGVALAPELALQAGVWDTHAERGLLALGARAPSSSALGRLRAATAAGDFAVIRPGATLETANLPYGPRTLESMQRDLAAGFVLIASATVEGDDAAWWRVDPATGETLGVVTGGYGTVQTEYLISFAATVGFSAAGTAACQAAGGSFVCCLANNAAVGAVGFGFGAGAGWLLGEMLAKTLYHGALLSATNALIFDLGLNIGLGYVPPFGCGT